MIAERLVFALCGIDGDRETACMPGLACRDASYATG